MLIYVTGIKGGVGKSFITNLVIYYFKNVLNVDPIVIDTDTSAPDIYWCNKDDIKNEDLITAKTATSDGWALLIKTAYENKDRYIVVNAPAKEDDSISEHGEFLDKLVERGVDIISFFVINDNGNAVKQLKLFRKYVKGKICVIKNSGKTKLEENDFKVFNESEFKDLPSVYIPCESTGYISTHTYAAKDEEKKSLSYILDEKTGDFGYVFMLEEWVKKATDKIKIAIESANNIAIEN